MGRPLFLCQRLTISMFDIILETAITIFVIEGCGPVARAKFQTLTEPMFYILLCLREECCGADVMARVEVLTRGRVSVGPGTLYNLLDSFLEAGMIRETSVVGRKRSYLITDKGRETLEAEYRRLLALTEDYKTFVKGENLG